jgi:pilus assembly protein CpaB
MNFPRLLSLVLSFVLAVVAVVGVNSYLNDQKRSGGGSAQSAVHADRKSVVVAVKPLKYGARLDKAQLAIVNWPKDSVPKGAFHSIEAVLSKTGSERDARYVLAKLERGEPILESKITKPGEKAILSAKLAPGKKAVSIKVNDVMGVAGFVNPGDSVDIMLIRRVREGGEDSSYSDVLLQGMKVLAIDQLVDGEIGKPSVAKTVTLEVDTREAQKLALAQSVGMLSLALRNIDSENVENVKPVSLSDLRRGSNREKVVDPVSKQVVKLSPNPTPEHFKIIGVMRGAKREEYKFPSR